ncbi:DUF3238 domain-containing protein [Paenibacillus sacheonensis]|uniref:DUF3238 domain-containing protein n=1 Tax=Paenibacillus sacheonensis TaxID=742054 RepID=A0A7X5C478_9BACL|nr:DUF3238 domain-containing protein [Paenibacillus sacheonensis]MBM7568395.1 hypothetical protein [Paenibacillus sacheonensis]NBC72094.1 DUF3238 domain-containing protein [Paenibacillus sacheonensis]
MADLVKIRAGVFIGGLHWLPAVRDPETGVTFEYAGDAREFTPHAVNTGRSQIEQEVVVDFARRKLFAYADTGLTAVKQTSADGKAQITRDKASVDGVRVEDEAWEAMTVSFTMRASVANPLRPGAPAVDYLLRVTVDGEDGSVEITGSHDGFPCFEFYKQVDFGEFQLLYSHDYRAAGDTPAAMDGGMEYHFERKL